MGCTNQIDGEEKLDHSDMENSCTKTGSGPEPVVYILTLDVEPPGGHS